MNQCYGEQLIALGTALAFEMSRKLSVDESVVIGALLNVIGDQLALLAAVNDACPPDNHAGGGKK